MVHIFLADGFEEIEALATVDILRRANIEVSMVSIMPGKQVVGAHNIAIEADLLFADADFSQSQMLILPGGMPGTKHLGEHTGLCDLLTDFNNQNGWIAAICAAPSVLGKLGLLQGRNAVCYPGFEQFLTKAIVTTDNVMLSNNIITSRGAGTAIEFALKLVALLKDTQLSNFISQSIIN